MARNLRQNKILDLISTYEIEKQEDLVAYLKKENFDITQATISRDIKELGLIKVMTANKKYKYAYVEDNETEVNKKYKTIFKEAVLSIHIINNSVILKTIKCLASSINSFIDKLGIENVLGSVFGDDTVNIIFDSNATANVGFNALNKIYYSN